VGEQLPVQVVHGVVFFAQAAAFSESRDSSTCWALLPNFDCHPNYFRTAATDFLGKRVPGAASGDLGHMHGRRVHAVHVGDDLNGADDSPC